GDMVAVAAQGGSRSMLIGLKSDQFTLVSATIPDWSGDLQEITDQICRDLPGSHVTCAARSTTTPPDRPTFRAASRTSWRLCPGRWRSATTTTTPSRASF